MKLLLYLVCALAAHQCAAAPLEGDVAMLEESDGLLPKADDEATINAEVNQAIQQDVNMDGTAKLGEIPKLGEGANSWEKKAMAQINSMSSSEIAKTKQAAPSKLDSKFAADIANAEKVMHKPGAKKTKKSMINSAVKKALANPKQAAKLKEAARQAEMDFVNPVALVEEKEEPNDIGEDEVDDDHLALMSGDDSDVMKSINEQIGTMVSDKLGNMPADTAAAATLDKFEKDKQMASEFLADKAKRDQAKADAKKKVEEELKSAQQDLGESQHKKATDSKAAAKKKIEAMLKASSEALKGAH